MDEGSLQDLVRPKHVAEQAKISRPYVYYLMRVGDLPTVLVDGSKYTTRSGVESWLKLRKEKTRSRK